MKYNKWGIILLILILANSTAFSIVKEYFINCNPEDFDAIYKKPYTDIYIPITMTYNGKTWDNLRMRIRGDDTRVHPKKSLKIKFDAEVFENGRDVLNFNAEYEDPTYICQYLSALTYRKIGYPCYEAEHARLYLNGKFLGLYLRVENMDASFLESRELDPTGNLYKATEDDACLSIYDDVNSLWEKKTNVNTGREDLQTLIDSLNYVPDNEYYDFAKRTFDYDKMIDIIAVNMLIAHGSTYYHNYFMYHDFFKTKKWLMMPWDMDKSFSQYGYLYPYHRSSSYTSPDNPFFERALLCEPIFNDIRNKITDLKNDFFNNEFFDPIVDSLKAELQESVNQDTTDNVPDLEKWYYYISGPKKYVSERYKQLQYQFDNFPRSFKVEPTPGYYQDSVKFVWHPSSHPAHKPITYNFYFGTKENLDDTSTTTLVSGLTDTIFIKKDLPKDGNYYWMVMVTDGNNYIEGFNYPNPIKIKKATELPCTINTDMTLTKENSPYSVNCNVEVKASANLNINEGVEVIFKGDYRILIRGSLDVKGTKSEPVRFVPEQSVKKWQNLYFYYTPTQCNLKNFYIYNGCLYSQNSKLRLDSMEMVFSYQDTAYEVPLMFFENTQAFLFNSKVTSNGNRQGFIIGSADDVAAKNNIFYNVPDAIEFSLLKNGLIENNVINYSTDDCIDLNACKDVVIRGNIIRNAVDKGISIGNENLGRPSENILIERNIISGCHTGVVVKDSSTAKVINNTIHENTFAFSCYEKRLGQGGGVVDIINTIISGNDTLIYLDSKSTAKFSYSLSDNSELPGEGNLKDNPMFVDAVNFDFRLLPNSPCIDAGDPNRPLDPDGTRADIGAFPFGLKNILPKVVINEINYNSANDFDTGDWVEFYNAGTEDIDISGWIFMDSDITHKYIFPSNTILGINHYLVLCRQFDLFYSIYPNLKNVVGEMDFGLSSTGELLRLYDKNLVLVDSVIYGVNAPWYSEANGKGSTLELIAPELDNTLAVNWRSSKEHGTPGRINGSDTTSIKDGEIFGFNCKPNPISDDAIITVNSQTFTNAEISIYDLLGEKIMQVLDGSLEPGSNQFHINLSKFSIGVYYCVLKTNDYSSTIILSYLR